MSAAKRSLAPKKKKAVAEEDEIEVAPEQEEEPDEDSLEDEDYVAQSNQKKKASLIPVRAASEEDQEEEEEEADEQEQEVLSGESERRSSKKRRKPPRHDPEYIKGKIGEREDLLKAEANRRGGKASKRPAIYEAMRVSMLLKAYRKVGIEDYVDHFRPAGYKDVLVAARTLDDLHRLPQLRDRFLRRVRTRQDMERAIQLAPHSKSNNPKGAGLEELRELLEELDRSHDELLPLLRVSDRDSARILGTMTDRLRKSHPRFCELLVAYDPDDVSELVAAIDELRESLPRLHQDWLDLCAVANYLRKSLIDKGQVSAYDYEEQDFLAFAPYRVIVRERDLLGERFMSAIFEDVPEAVGRVIQRAAKETGKEPPEELSEAAVRYRTAYRKLVDDHQAAQRRQANK